jgi:hypothetical protein
MDRCSVYPHVFNISIQYGEMIGFTHWLLFIRGQNTGHQIGGKKKPGGGSIWNRVIISIA